MTKLQWNQVGERFYEAGIDRGVLYLTNGSGVAWSGLTEMSEAPSSGPSTPIYFDGQKRRDLDSLGDFAATLSAITFPDEFLEFDGFGDLGDGMFVDDQYVSTFGLSYRTKIANDSDGTDYGYKIHILYNLTASPDEKTYQTLSSVSKPTQFAWKVDAKPESLPNYRPTAHVIIDSTKIHPELLSDIEVVLYGNDSTEPFLPPLSDFYSFIVEWSLMTIIDNGDGTWTAEGPDYMVYFTDATTFEINSETVTYLDADTYTVENYSP